MTKLALALSIDSQISYMIITLIIHCLTLCLDSGRMEWVGGGSPE